MKKIITVILICVSLSASAQSNYKPLALPPDERVKDSVIRIELTQAQWQQLVSIIDQSIDSKKSSKEVFDLLIKNAALVPKEEKKK